MISAVIKAVSFGFGRILFRNRTTSAISGVLIVAGLLFAWHTLDKNSAVRQAVDQYVAEAEITSLRAQIAEANRRAAVAEDATERLEEQAQVARGEAIRLAAEIEQYEAANDIPSSGRVEPDLFDRLRGN